MDAKNLNNAFPNKCFSQFQWIHKQTHKSTKHTFDKLPTNVIPIAPISNSFQYNHYILESNTSKNFTINRYQLPLASAFCFTNFKTQRQIFDHLTINVCQPSDDVRLNMHNIYITLSCLHSIDGLIILRDITIQDISKIELKFKGPINTITSTSKHDVTKEKHKHCTLKSNN
jgi:hypothetical protein